MNERPAPRTFDLDRTLAPLPAPSLEDTCERYLATVEPLVDEAGFAQTRAAVEELKAEGELGQELHAALLKRASRMDNWLAGWWEDFAYLGYQEPLIVNSSIGISTDARHAPGDQAMRAAQLTAGTLDFYLSIVHETMPPEIQRDGSAFDMSLLKRFFATNRFPGLASDRIVTYGFEESRHLLVIRRGHYYTFEAISKDGSRLSGAELMAQFRRIIDAADAAPAVQPVGLLTADARNVWALERDRISRDPHNRATLNIIDRALLIVCLDAKSHRDFEALARAGLYGSKGDRWYDKSFALVIDRDGRFTLHGEHSPVDAGAWVPLIEAIGGEGQPIATCATGNLPRPAELSWKIDKQMLEAIAAAEARYDQLTGDLDLRIVHFDAFGKELIKTFKTGPDPFVQMSFMLAYWRLYGRLPKTYEAASTRMFRGGRTETIRTASPHALAFVKAMDDASLSDAEKMEFLRAAFTEHGKRGKEASAGQGVDRHLLGLRLIAAEMGIRELPRLFNEEVYKRGWELSTAQLPMKIGFVNHFGPVCPDGYGIGYVIKDDHININITSFRSHPKTDSSSFAAAVSQALRDLRALGERAQSAS